MSRNQIMFVALPAVLLSALASAQALRTPWGDPDLQGKWSNATLTPLQRPAELKDKEFFTEEEAKAYVRQRIAATSGDENIERDRSAGNVGSYNDAWMDRGNDIVPTRRTSLIVEPANGRVPPFTAAAQREHERNLAHAAAHPADTPEDRYLTERCIVFGGGPAPMLPEPYNNNYYIVQTRDEVAIMAELNHEVRIIPIDGRPHLPAGVRQWTGRFTRPMGRGHARRRDHEPDSASAFLRRANARLRDERRVSRGRALHAHRARADSLSCHRVRSRVHGAVDRRNLHAPAGRRARGIRLP